MSILLVLMLLLENNNQIVNFLNVFKILNSEKVLTWPIRTFFKGWGWRSSNYITGSGSIGEKLAILLLTIVEKVSTGWILVIELTRQLTNGGGSDVAKIFQEVSIVHAIALSKFLQIRKRNLKLTFQNSYLTYLYRNKIVKLPLI